MGPLSGDLRKRVVWVVCAEGMSLSRVRAAVRGELLQRDPLGGGVARARELRAAADGRRHAFTAGRGARGFSAWPSSARA